MKVVTVMVALDSKGKILYLHLSQCVGPRLIRLFFAFQVYLENRTNQEDEQV